MLYFSSLLKNENLFSALKNAGEEFSYLNGTKDIWARDYMPVKSAGKEFVSFSYSPSYLKEFDDLRTDYFRDVYPFIGIAAERSDIRLDGGNTVFSPQKRKVIITDRFIDENPEYTPDVLIRKTENLLGAEVIIIPALKSDMTGHADGVVRFINENAVAGNSTAYKNGYEQKVKKVLKTHGIDTVDFPYFESDGISAQGCYINFLKTENNIFLPVFNCKTDASAVSAAKIIFNMNVIPVEINSIARCGGGLNCISWET